MLSFLHSRTATKPEVAGQVQVFDRDGLIDRMMGDEDLARRVVDRFVSDMPAQLRALAAAVEATDTKHAHELAHSLKGAASNVGVAALTQLAAAMESAAHDGDASRVKETFPALRTEFDRTKAVLATFLAER